MVPRPPFFAASLAIALTTVAARASPTADTRDDAIEERLANGDLDSEDGAAIPVGASVVPSTMHDQSWVSVVGFERDLLGGRRDVGGFLVVGLALDRIFGGGSHALADPAEALPPPARSPPPDPPKPVEVRLASPSLARRCVAAAWRAAGLGPDDAAIDALVSRSRSSALLPETRFRAMRLWDDAAHATTLATTNDTTYYDAIGANLVLEVRFTWRLDRLLYAGDEATLERVRLERQEARARLAGRTLEALFAWQRARVDITSAGPALREQAEARLRAAEAEATLDVLTAGWFSAQDPPRGPDSP
jgi:hypothetical protein